MKRLIREPALTDEGKRMVEIAAEAMNMPAKDIIGRSQFRMHTSIRQAIMWALRAKGYSLPTIGHQLGRDHTSVMQGLRTAEAMRERHAWYRILTDRLAQ